MVAKKVGSKVEMMAGMLVEWRAEMMVVRMVASWVA